MKDMTLRFSGTEIKAALESQGRRQDWLAEQLGVAPSTVNRWLSGTRSIDLTNAKRIADILGVDIFLLLNVPIGTESEIIGTVLQGTAA